MDRYADVKALEHVIWQILVLAHRELRWSSTSSTTNQDGEPARGASCHLGIDELSRTPPMRPVVATSRIDHGRREPVRRHLAPRTGCHRPLWTVNRLLWTRQHTVTRPPVDTP